MTVAKQDKALFDLHSAGIHVLPRFLAQEACSLLCREVDGLLARYKSYVQVDAVKADMRLFGADRVSLMLAAIFNDPFVRKVVERYEGACTDGVAMVNRVTFQPGNQGSGQGWHRDNIERKQTKAIIYLNDVADHNGPFEYISGSASPSNSLKVPPLKGRQSTGGRFSAAEVQGFVDSRDDIVRRTVTGPAGTLILADTHGIHRGAPLTKGSRYAATLYLWTSNDLIPSDLEPYFLPRME